MKKSNRQRKANRPRKPKQYPRLFPGTQQNVVSVSKLAWGYCLTLIARFFNFSTIYTAEYVAAKVSQADVANALPNKEQRDNPKRTAHVALKETNAEVCLQWQVLKRYIKGAYPKNLWKIKLEAAGYKQYSLAKGMHWENTMNLIKDAKEFMATYRSDLEANNNMPKTFPDDFATVVTAFETERNLFVSNSQSGMDGTTTKDKAIYEVELELSKLLDVGKVIFDKEPDLLRKFTYTDLINEVRGNDPSGVKGYLDNATNGQPMAGVVVSSSGYTTTSDENGKYELRMASGTYDISFEKEGFEPLVLKGRLVKVGVMGRFNADLQEAQPGEATASDGQATGSGETATTGETDVEQPAPGA